MRLTELSPNTFRIALRLDPVMSVHQSIGLNTVVVPLETFSKTSLNNSQIRATFSLSSKQRVVNTCLPSIGCRPMAHGKVLRLDSSEDILSYPPLR